MNVPRYSVVIPVYNGMPYIKACVESIVEQNYTDYELIISDDHSSDGSGEYLRSLRHPNLVLLKPEKGLSMAEHWEWALSHARGEWQIFVGQDDGLQAYFFSHADRLSAEAERRNLRAIVSRRGYYFWPGCESTYKSRVSYAATNDVDVKSLPGALLKALFTTSYHNLPQMYCNSIFKKSLLEEAREKQGGRVFVSHPQDANLAAICCKLENKYLWSGIPLGWVGTSPKSAGHAVSQGVKVGKKTIDKTLDDLRSEYVERVTKSDIKYHYLAGDFGFDDAMVYFWQSLLRTSSLNKSCFDDVVGSSWFRYLFLSSVVARVGKEGPSAKKQEMLHDLISRNGFRYGTVFLGSVLFKVFYLLARLYEFAAVKVPRKLMRVLKVSSVYSYSLSAAEDPGVSMNKAGDDIAQRLKGKRWV